MYDSFKFEKVMLDAWLELKDDKMKADYFVALAKYWLYRELPTDPIIRALLQYSMCLIDKSTEKSDTLKSNAKKNKWNQYTKWDEKRKASQEAQKKAVEQIGANWSKLEQSVANWSKKQNMKI